MGPQGMNVRRKGTTDPDRMLQAEPNVTKRRHEIRLRQDAKRLRIWDLRPTARAALPGRVPRFNFNPLRARPRRAVYRA